MKETHRFVDGIREEPDNIYCYQTVGGVTLDVGPIEVEGQKAVVTVNPNITNYESAISKPFFWGTSSMQSISYEGEFGPGAWLSVNQAVIVPIDGKRFIIRPVKFGYSNERDGKLGYCDIEVEAVGNPPQ